MSSGSGLSSDHSTGLREDYFSVDDLLTTQERLPCKFETQVYNLGYIDPGLDSAHIPKGSKMELPYWLARSLCTRRKHCVNVELPKQYKEGYREVFNADANVVDLHKMGPYFYAFGSYLLQFEHPESPDIAKSMLKTFQTRFRDIMDSSQNAYYEDTNKLIQRLDEMEKIIFANGQRGLHDFQKWEMRQAEKLTTSEMVLNHRKRKRAAMENS